MADETTTAPETEAPSATEEQPQELGDAGKQAIDRMKAERDEARRTAKAHEREIEKLRTANMDDNQRAIAEAEARGRAAVAAEYGQRLARAEFVAAAARRNGEYDAAAVLDDLNLARYVLDDGDADVPGIAAAVERLIPAATANPRPVGDADLGTRSTALPLNGDPLLNDLKSKLGIT